MRKFAAVLKRIRQWTDCLRLMADCWLKPICVLPVISMKR